MKQAWQPVASVARSTIPCSIGISSSDEDDELDDAVQGAVLLAEAARARWSRRMRLICAKTHMLAAANGCPGPLPGTGRAGYTSVHDHAATQRRRRSADRQRRRGSSSCSLSSSTCTASRAPSSCPRHHLDDLLTDGAGFAGFAAGDIGQGPHDPDLIAMPDPSTLHDPALAAATSRGFACDVTVEGEPWPYCPRTILRTPARARWRRAATS